MFYKRITACMIALISAVSITACGKSTNTGSGNVEPTAAVSTEASSQEQTTDSSLSQSVLEKASLEELSRKMEEVKSSMAAAVEEASREAASQEEAARQEQESIVAARKEEAESQEATLRESAAETANKVFGPDSEVITVVDDYGVESAKLQYTANYSIYVELVRLTNELRASLGVAPLQMDENICIASCKKAVDYYLADYYDGQNHKMIDGRRWQALYEDFNIVATARAENLAKGPSFKTARAMFEGWKNSKIHYDNMVNPAYTRVGVGSCGYVWFMDLAN